MTKHVSEAVLQLEQETVDALQDVIRALNDSSQYMIKAADSIRKDGLVANTLRNIAGERMQICDQISNLIELSDENPDEEGTFLGSLRTIWTRFRAALNSGDPTVVLVEAQRAEDAIVRKFKLILPEIVGNPLSAELQQHFARVKDGHDRVLNLRNAYQNA